MNRDYILMTTHNGFKGVLEICIDDKITKAEFNNFEISVDLGEYNEKIKKAMDTGLFMQNYQRENNLEVFNPICVVMR